MTGKNTANTAGKNHSEQPGVVSEIAGFKPMKPRKYGSLKAVVAAAVDQAGGVPTVADLLQRSAQTVYGYTDPREENAMSLAQAEMLTRFAHATAFAEHFAALAGGVFLPQADGNPGLIAQLGAEAQLLSGSFFASVIRAIEDGTITGEENAELRRRLDPLIRVLATAQSKLIAASNV